MPRRAVASRLPFNGAPAETIGVFTGIIVQSKPAPAQRLPILKDGVRQMVMEAAHRANDEQVAILAKHRAVIAAAHTCWVRLHFVSPWAIVVSS